MLCRVQDGAAICADEQAVYQGLLNSSAVNNGIGQDSAGDADANTSESACGLLERGYGGNRQQMSFEHLDRRIRFEGRHSDRAAAAIDRMRRRVRHARAIAHYLTGVAEGDDSRQQEHQHRYGGAVRSQGRQQQVRWVEGVRHRYLAGEQKIPQDVPRQEGDRRRSDNSTQQQGGAVGLSVLRADSHEALEGVLPFLCRARLEDEGYAFLQQEVAHRGEPPLWLMRAKPSGAWVGCQYAIRQARPSLSPNPPKDDFGDSP